jgi:hypothetical protein
MKETLKEMMQKWNEARAAWILANGNDIGFAEWFTAQVMK